MIHGVTSCVVFERKEKNVIIAQTQSAAGLSINARLHSFLPLSYRPNPVNGYVHQDGFFDVGAILADYHCTGHAGRV